ncbi:nucleotide-diphospho-sugar transferase, partial [Lindgomyces ingoldianus]
WSQYAYVQYATDKHYLCNAVMVFEALHRLGSRADRVLLHPKEWIGSVENGMNGTYEHKLMVQAGDLYNVKFVSIETQTERAWPVGFTKLLAFNQTQYKRVILLNSNAMVLQPMDELFFLRRATVAIPHAYWTLDKPSFLSSHLVVLEPSKLEFGRVTDAMLNPTVASLASVVKKVNALYSSTSLILPHRDYNLRTNEFTKTYHQDFLGPDRGDWDAIEVWKRAKFVHFSDSKYPKPWIKPSPDLRKKYWPRCPEGENGREEESQDICREREVWVSLYDSFSLWREVC